MNKIPHEISNETNNPDKLHRPDVIAKLTSVISQQHHNFFQTYILIRCKRYLAHTTMVFAFQYLTIMNMSFSLPVSPYYPPMGIAFITFYLFGSNAILGLILGSICAYFLKGFSAVSIILYLTADIGFGCLTAFLCQAVFSSDIRPFAAWCEVLNFIKINLFVTLFSSLLRLIAFALIMDTSNKQSILLFNYIILWLADFNAIFILSAFLLSWVTIPFTREKISQEPFKKTFGITFIIFITCSLLFTKKYDMIYFYILSMFWSIYMSYLYGYLIATGLLFVMSSIYLVYFIAHKEQFVLNFGMGQYSLVPMLLFAFSLCMIYTGHLKKSIVNDCRSLSPGMKIV